MIDASERVKATTVLPTFLPTAFDAPCVTKQGRIYMMIKHTVVIKYRSSLNIVIGMPEALCDVLLLIPCTS
jgi:hypothetical protein